MSLDYSQLFKNAKAVKKPYSKSLKAGDFVVVKVINSNNEERFFYAMYENTYSSELTFDTLDNKNLRSGRYLRLPENKDNYIIRKLSSSKIKTPTKKVENEVPKVERAKTPQTALEKRMKDYGRTQSIVEDDEIIFREDVFAGSVSKPKFLGQRFIQAIVKKESYGKEKAQHSFTLEVIKSDGVESFEKGKRLIRKGRTIYKSAVKVKESANFTEKQLEKNKRSAEAKMKKYYNWYNEGKFEKIPDEFYKITGLKK